MYFNEVQVLEEQMEENRKRREKQKGKQAKDRVSSGATAVIQEDMEMKDRSASRDGYEYLFRYEEAS